MWPQKYFWTFTKATLEDIERAVVPSFQIGSREIIRSDYEELKGEDGDGRKWHIMRFPRSSWVEEDPPVHIVIIPQPNDPEYIAELLCGALGSEILFGDVRNLHEYHFSYSDDFRMK